VVVCTGKIETLKRSIEEVRSRRRFVTPAAASATPDHDGDQRDEHQGLIDISHMMFTLLRVTIASPAPLRSPRRLAAAANNPVIGS
jgi:hypothetical protein